MTLSDVTGVNHVSIPVRDVDGVAAFYGDVLGLPQLARPEASIGRPGAWFGVSEVQLHLVTEADPPAPTRRHIGLVVSDFDAAVARLRERGVPLVEGPGVRASSGVKFVRIRDPEGNLIELLSKRYESRPMEE